MLENRKFNEKRRVNKLDDDPKVYISMSLFSRCNEKASWAFSFTTEYILVRDPKRPLRHFISYLALGKDNLEGIWAPKILENNVARSRSIFGGDA
jgi:hypothetical protein